MALAIELRPERLMTSFSTPPLQILRKPLDHFHHPYLVMRRAAETIRLVVLGAGELDDLLGLAAGSKARQLLLDGDQFVALRIDEEDGPRRDSPHHPLGLVAQLTEAAAPRELFERILGLIGRLRPVAHLT